MINDLELRVQGKLEPREREPGVIVAHHTSNCPVCGNQHTGKNKLLRLTDERIWCSKCHTEYVADYRSSI